MFTIPLMVAAAPRSGLAGGSGSPVPQPLKKVEMQVPVAVFDRERQRILTQLPSMEGLRLLVDAPEEVKADRDFMMAAVTKSGDALRFASEGLRSDRGLVMTAVSRLGASLEYASEELRSDRVLVMTAVSKHWGALKYASEELRSDRDVVMAAASSSWRALQHASEELRSDADIVASTNFNFGSPQPQALVLKATLLSGRSCTLVVPLWDHLEDILRDCGASLALKVAAGSKLITSDGTTLSSLDELQPAMLNEVTLVLS